MTTFNQAVRTFNQRRATEAALSNEQLTRERVERLERRLEAATKAEQELRAILAEFKARRLRERLRWIVLGR